MAKIKTPENTSKKAIIISEAANLFKEKGYRKASMRDIASRLGVEAASLYNHIDGKSELLKIICYKISDNFNSHIAQIEAQEVPTLQKVESLIRFHVHGMIYNYDEVHVSDREWRNMEEPYLSEYRELRRGYRKRFAALIQYGIDNNEVKSIDANTIVMIFLNAIAAVDQWHRIVHKVESDKLEEYMVSILVDGIRK